VHSFQDAASPPRTWEITINVTQLKRVRGLLNLDLYKIASKVETLNESLSDPVQLVDVCYVLCKDAADSAKVSDEDFGRGLAGDAIIRARDAFMEELIDFFPDEKARNALRKLTAASRQVGSMVVDRLTTQAATMLDGLDLEKEADKITANLTASLKTSSTSVPPSSESTPVRSPYES